MIGLTILTAAASLGVRAANPSGGMSLTTDAMTIPDVSGNRATIGAVVTDPGTNATVSFSLRGRACGSLAATMVPIDLYQFWKHGKHGKYTKLPPSFQAINVYTPGTTAGLCTIGAAEHPNGYVATLSIAQPKLRNKVGYWLVTRTGGVRGFGSLLLCNPICDLHGVTPVVGLASSHFIVPPGGYYPSVDLQLLTQAGFVGDIYDNSLSQIWPEISHNLDAVAYANAPNSNGDWILMANGRVITQTDETGPGQVVVRNLGGVPMLSGSSDRAVGLAVDPSRWGYWIATRSGHVFARGVAPFLGSPFARGFRGHDVVAIVSGWHGAGYWVVTGTGRVFAFGSAPREATSGRCAPPGTHDVVGVASGYSASAKLDGGWLVAADGHVFPCGVGHVPYFGSLVGHVVRSDPVAAIAAAAVAPQGADLGHTPLCSSKQLHLSGSVTNLELTNSGPFCQFDDVPGFAVVMPNGTRYPIRTLEWQLEYLPPSSALGAGGLWNGLGMRHGYKDAGNRPYGFSIQVGGSNTCPHSSALEVSLPGVPGELIQHGYSVPVCRQGAELSAELAYFGA